MKLDQNSFMEDNRGERFSPWTSYSDMFCSLMMLFVLLFVFLLMQYVSVKAKDALELSQARSELEQSQAELQGAQTDLSRSEEDLADTRTALAQRESYLADVRTALAQREGDLADTLSALEQSRSERDGLSADLSRTQSELDGAQSALRQSESDLAVTQLALTRTQQKLDTAQSALTRREEELEAARASLSQTQDELQSANDALKQRESDLAMASAQASDRGAQLDAVNAALDDTRAELEAANAALDDTRAQLDAANTALDDTRAELDAANAALVESDADGLKQRFAQAEAELKDTRRLLDEANGELELLRSDDSVAVLTDQVAQLERELLEQQAAFERVAGLRMEIVQDVSRALVDSGISTSVDPDSGSIVIGSEMLFSVNQSTLRPEGKAFLDAIFPVYFQVLTEGTYSDSVAQIIIEGHTDSRGDYLTNMELSSARAQSVLDYCYGMMTGEQRQTFVRKVVATGCSFSNPVLNADGTENSDQSRRVVIKFNLKDQTMIEQMTQIVSGN